MNKKQLAFVIAISILGFLALTLIMAKVTVDIWNTPPMNGNPPIEFWSTWLAELSQIAYVGGILGGISGAIFLVSFCCYRVYERLGRER